MNDKQIIRELKNEILIIYNILNRITLFKDTEHLQHAITILTTTLI